MGLKTKSHQADNHNDRQASVEETHFAGCLICITQASLFVAVYYDMVHKCHYHPINADCCGVL